MAAEPDRPVCEFPPARVADAAAIAAIAACTLPEPWTVTAVRAQLRQPVCRARVARTPERLFGFLLASRVLDEVEIRAFAVHPDAQGLGLGRALLRAFLSGERAAGVVRVQLDVRAGNVAARALYRDCGFAVCGERPRYYRDGETAVLMSAAL